jgi:hypothetical protein
MAAQDTAIVRAYRLFTRAELRELEKDMEWMEWGIVPAIHSILQRGGLRHRSYVTDTGDDVVDNHPAEAMALSIFSDAPPVATRRLVTLYSVTDDTPKGDTLLVSVVHSLTPDDPTEEALRIFLDALGFQPNYLGFGDRPAGRHHFPAFWDDLIAPLSDLRFQNK